MTIPRLTGALRAFSTISSPSDREGQDEDLDHPDLIEEKRKERAKRIKSKQFNWQKFYNLVKSSVSDSKQRTELDKDLKKLHQYAHQIVGDGSESEVIDSAALFIFNLFDGSAGNYVTHSNTQTLKSSFGSFPTAAANEACSTVANICRLLSDEVITKITSSINGTNEAADSTKSSKYFGHKIKFSVASLFSEQPNREDLSWMDVDLEKVTTVTTGSGFNMLYKKPETKPSAEIPKKGPDPAKETFGMEWLLNQIEIYFGSGVTSLGLNANELSTSVFDMLCSCKTDAELQEELFDLLGFDRFELIEGILTHRRDIIAVTRMPDKQLKTLPAKTDTVRPNFASQITVQTEEEKQIYKQMRREEKKAGRLIKKDEGNDDDESLALNLNYQELRAYREEQLSAAASAPLFCNKSSSSQSYTPIQYPNVYDSNITARQTPGFIGGAKLLLPLGCEKSSNSKYEEVNIPANEKIPPNISRKLIPISELDDICQLAFQGAKSLNLIQSAVYNTAYKSNENMLICAPTGAGKTNTAMLTVLREIKQHIHQGVLKRDEFKIVYVAPMKALAAEMVRNFGQRLAALGITVAELTGDMQLTKAEIMKTQMLVTTPEKWDVVTRKSTGDVALTQIVRLLIIDEVHLLHDDRGAVIETLVARTLRQVESSQTMIRIIGLSATLPNYIDVARFLNVNPHTGLYFFDGRFRPVPLAQTFIGIKTTQRMQQLQDFNSVCYEKVQQQVRNGHQVMVFVHARNETVRTASVLCEMAKNQGHIMMFTPESSPKLGDALKQIEKSRNRQLKELFSDGFGIHHAGMLRQDRNLVERYFAEGLIRCIVCTATLAWGVNLPAHAVIIKGTQIYDAKKGSFVDLGILDVMQIFGRAGRPQYDTFGHGTILTSHDRLSHYLSLLTQQNPIESQFVNSLVDNLNAEISLGTVTNVDEAVKWLRYTYLYVRMRCNPLVYGIPHQELMNDPELEKRRRDLVIEAGRKLDKARMIRFDERTGYMFSTDNGRTASHFYVKYDTVEIFNELFSQVMSEDKVLEMISKAQEFDQIKVRDEELEELDRHLNSDCQVAVAGGSENTYGKVNILLQTYISRGSVENFSLISDQAYIVQNAARIVRALFEMAIRKNWPLMSGRLLQLSKVMEKRLWAWENPLRQFQSLPSEVLDKLEERGLSVTRLQEMDAKEIGHMIRHVNMGPRIKECVNWMPQLSVETSIQPITRTVLRVILSIKSEFRWNDRVHGKIAEPFWIWVEDPENNHIYHAEYFLLHKKHAVTRQVQTVVFTIPIFEPLPTQYMVKVTSDRWLGSESMFPLSFRHLILPEKHPPHTELLDLQPLPVTALRDEKLQALYRFSHFNPIQTQIFHVLYHTDRNVLLGAPTGSGKTVAAELAIFRVFREHPGMKAVYIAPLKALVRERMEDWKVRIEERLGKRVVELTGDVAPDMKAVARADLIVTTPEKWDGISRSWKTRSYVKDVALLVIDEIHLLGDDRGPVLEVIVSRTNFISSHTDRGVRVVGLSTALANAKDLADWLDIKHVGLYNFRPSVRPVPLEVHISGFPGKHYCPRMATMNKPTFQAIRTHSPDKPVLVFVSSRRQTRLTALDLIAFLAAEDDPKQWLHLPEEEMDNIIMGIKDSNLKLTLAFGIGLHHAGLHERDRKVTEELFVNQKIQVLIATSTLAWGVNFPAHLVVVKGTEYFDGKTKSYVDFPITDVLQMMGRAGRPQFDNEGKAVILVHDAKKHFYKKFLYEPFPVESNLLGVLADHLNAEIVAGTICSKQDAMDYLTWTYFFRRLVMNPRAFNQQARELLLKCKNALKLNKYKNSPTNLLNLHTAAAGVESYYNLEDVSSDSINRYLSHLIEKAVQDLSTSYCVEVDEDGVGVGCTSLGRIASYYYLSHLTVRNFRSHLSNDIRIPDLIKVLADSHEFHDIPVRHNEDQVNSELAQHLPIRVDVLTYDSSNTKAHLLLQAHFCRQPLPIADYITDTKSVMDQAIRVCQAMLDVAGGEGWLITSLQIITLIQMLIQGLWSHQDSLLQLPHITYKHLPMLKGRVMRVNNEDVEVDCLPALIQYVEGKFERLEGLVKDELPRNQIEQILHVLTILPVIEVSVSLKCNTEEEAVSKQIQLQGSSRSSLMSREWIELTPDQEYILEIKLSRLNKSARKDTRAYAPKFQKVKDEGWMIVLGEVETRELIALKRLGYVQNNTHTQLTFYSPERPGRVIYTLYLMSDSYLGLDQQYDICLDVTDGAGKTT